MNAEIHDLARIFAISVHTVLDPAKAIASAREILAPSLASRGAPLYPVAALGPLAPACEALALNGQVQPAMVGQCLLGAASLVTQGLFNVETLASPRPLSLFMLTLGDSGDGKSTAQGAALKPVHDWQRIKGKKFNDDLAAFRKDVATRKRGSAPADEPSSPYRIVGDATVEGLRRDLDTGPCSQGVFSDEAAAILCGYGMSSDHRSKTAGVFSKLWDEGHLSVSRAGGPRIEKYGRRVAVHMLIQPMAASESIGDPMLSALGFWPRFLVAWPEAQAPRLARAFRPETLAAVREYWSRCTELLDERLPEDASTCPVLPLASDAREYLGRAFEEFEIQGRRGSLKMIKPYALRATEQACRIAGVLAAFAGEHEVTAAMASNAVALVTYSLKTWRALIDDGAADQTGAHAMRLYEWLTTRPGWGAPLSVIVNAGPVCVRTKDKRDAAIALLETAGLVTTHERHAYAIQPEQPADLASAS